MKVKCKICGDIIESKSTHDFVRCKCDEIFVDGGMDYCRVGAKTSIENVMVMDDTGMWRSINDVE